MTLANIEVASLERCKVNGVGLIGQVASTKRGGLVVG